MAILSASNVNMTFLDKMLFSGVSFEVGEKERVGLVGPNGCGKTTLFKLIIGELEPTEGQIVKARDARLGYMEQHACVGSPRNIYEEMLTVFSDLIEMERELERLSSAIENAGENGGDLDVLIHRQHELSEQFESRDGLFFRGKVRATLLGLGFSEQDFRLTCTEISGGQRSKLSLGKLLLSGADLLLLDEPTNHLDINSVEWLEGFLESYRGSVVIISHDRYFLDKVTTKTMDFADRTLRVWKGNYSAYQKLRTEKNESERRQYVNQMDEIHRIEGIIEQQRRFGQKRNFITISSKEKMLEKKKADLVQLETAESEVRFQFRAVVETGNEVAVVKGLKKSFGDKKLFENVSFQIGKNDRIFLLGANGCGKTTLLRIMTNRLKADNGTVKLGTNVKVGYFDQSLAELNHEKTVLDEIWDLHRSMTITEVRGSLAAFLFRGEDVHKRTGELSGGEKARVALLKLVLSGANVLLLDEPTNHLDIGSREALENALIKYGGTLLVVSHDRYFINKLCTRVFHLMPDGVREYLGDYDAYAEKMRAQAAQKPLKQVSQSDYRQRRERESEQRRLMGKIKRCEEAIDQLDDGIDKLTHELALPEVASDYEKVLDVTHRLESLRQEQEARMLEWENLQEENVKFNER
ncbi:MAG: ABC-F family ATP-binding cassette domain-containing protein [Oscillospiraceae bacterium]|nr:ABC-F family ATP-binding cassette domain-containing protein [Oscillospiraceae bacterium]